MPSSTPSGSLPSLLLEKYEVLYQIGEGVHGVVVAAKRKIDDLVVAIKAFRRRDVARWMPDTNREAIPMEIYVTKTFSGHKHIVRYIDHTYHDGYYYLITQLYGTPWMTTDVPDNAKGVLAGIPTSTVHCHDLWYYLDQKDVYEADLKKIFKQVAKAVRTLHRRGFCHGDIKDQVRWYFFFFLLL